MSERWENMWSDLCSEAESAVTTSTLSTDPCSVSSSVNTKPSCTVSPTGQVTLRNLGPPALS